MISHTPKQEIVALSRCLHQGFTGTIIRYINRKEIESEDDIRELLNMTAKHFLRNSIDSNKDNIKTLNNTLKNVLIWYKIKTEKS